MVIFLLVLFLVLLWLSCRGQFMLLHCVVVNRGEVSVPWRKFAREAASLWRFRLILAALSLGNTIIFVSVLLWNIFGFQHQKLHSASSHFAVLLSAGVLFGLVYLLLEITRLFTTQFVTPIMFLKGGTCSEGWQVFSKLLFANPQRFLLYLLFQFLLMLAIVLGILFAILCTCCLGALLLMIPFVGTAILLPIILFERSYQLYYLAQYGREFDLFQLPRE